MSVEGINILPPPHLAPFSCGLLPCVEPVHTHTMSRCVRNLVNMPRPPDIDHSPSPSSSSNSDFVLLKSILKEEESEAVPCLRSKKKRCYEHRCKEEYEKFLAQNGERNGGLVLFKNFEHSLPQEEPVSCIFNPGKRCRCLPCLKKAAREEDEERKKSCMMKTDTSCTHVDCRREKVKSEQCKRLELVVCFNNVGMCCDNSCLVKAEKARKNGKKKKECVMQKTDDCEHRVCNMSRYEKTYFRCIYKEAATCNHNLCARRARRVIMREMMQDDVPCQLTQTDRSCNHRGCKIFMVSKKNCMSVKGAGWKRPEGGGRLRREDFESDKRVEELDIQPVKSETKLVNQYRMPTADASLPSSSHSSQHTGQDEQERQVEQTVKYQPETDIARQKKAKCEICEKHFASTYNLTRHMRSLHKVEQVKEQVFFNCEKCSAVFTRKDQLAKHVSDKHKLMPRKHCRFCDSLFDDSTSFLKHVKSVHVPQTDFAIERQAFNGKTGEKRSYFFIN